MSQPSAFIDSPEAVDPLKGLGAHTSELIRTGAMFHHRGWSLGTSSNYSVVLGRDPLELLVTASGKDKGQLAAGDFVRINGEGRPAVTGQPKSSAETMLHVMLARRFPEVGSVLHTHSVWGTLLSNRYYQDGGLAIEGYEMLKGLEGITTHESCAWVPIFDNTQDISALAEEVGARLAQPQSLPMHGFLIRRHGLYTWGRDLAEARRHVEIFEFLFECVGREMQM